MTSITASSFPPDIQAARLVWFLWLSSILPGAQRFPIYLIHASKERVIFLVGQVEDYNGQTWFVAQLLFLESGEILTRYPPVNIHSPGGFGHGRMAILWTPMQFTSPTSHTVHRPGLQHGFLLWLA